jgi:hypothetical protein
MTADQVEDIGERAEKLYAARSAIAETDRPVRRLGVAEILRFLNDPQHSLTMEEQRSLFANPQVRADYRRLKSQAAVADLPVLAAASAGDVKSRRFSAGTVDIHPSRIPGQTYVLFRLSSPLSPPRTMLIESSKGDLVKRALPPADANGEIMMVLDEKVEADATFLRLICDPTASGSFLL